MRCAATGGGAERHPRPGALAPSADPRSPTGVGAAQPRPYPDCSALTGRSAGARDRRHAQPSVALKKLWSARSLPSRYDVTIPAAIEQIKLDVQAFSNS